MPIISPISSNENPNRFAPKDHLKPGPVFFQVNPLIAGGPLGIDQTFFFVKPDT
jgi:hypothetical protein